MAKTCFFVIFINNSKFRFDVTNSYSIFYYEYFAIKSGYRFAFNGQEKVDEISGLGNHNTAEYWEYDTRLGRRWNIDPEPKAWESPYAGFANNPIWFTDPNGRDTIVNPNGEKMKMSDGYAPSNDEKCCMVRG
ncbi:MAG: hypothetical protein IPK10_05555 [Bacteroidetes bacterium]|nr:hypothetical protein [Bacteroidota bacterium]